MENSGNPGGWICPECGPGVKSDDDGCCKHCGRDADPDQKHLAALTARLADLEAFVEKVRAERDGIDAAARLEMAHPRTTVESAKVFLNTVSRFAQNIDAALAKLDAAKKEGE